MTAMLLASMMCLSVFGALRSMSKLALTTAVRSEAHRLLQAEAERLIATNFSDFTVSSDQTIASCIKTGFAPSNEAQFAYPASDAGRVSFTRRVVEVASSSTTKTLRVEVEWTWDGRFSIISTPLFRAQ